MIVAVLDACVLYPPSLRDLLMRLAADGIYAPRWTRIIQEEWVRNVLANNQAISQAQLERTCSLMERVDPDCIVTGYEAHIPALLLPDLNDRHVLAAAIVACAPIVVTFNLSDFPAATLQPYGIRAVHPDHFLSALFDEDTDAFLQAAQRHRASLRNPPKTAQDYIETLIANRLSELAHRIETYRDVI